MPYQGRHDIQTAVADKFDYDPYSAEPQPPRGSNRALVLVVIVGLMAAGTLATLLVLVRAP